MIVALDVGTVRVGCATADATVKIPFPKAVWPAAQNRAERAVLDLLSKEAVETLVVGIPLDEDGNETVQCESVRRFAARLAKRTSIPIVFVDEADSSQEARGMMREAGGSEDMLDAFAACCILSRYFSQKT